VARSSVSTPRSSNQDVRISRIRLSDKEARGTSVAARAPWVAVFGSRTFVWEVDRPAPLSLSFSSTSGLLELRPLPSTGVTRLPRYYEPVRHPRRPDLSLAGVRLGSRFPPLGLPLLQQFPMC
jgi:hypothetical protein